MFRVRRKPRGGGLIHSQNCRVHIVLRPDGLARGGPARPAAPQPARGSRGPGPRRRNRQGRQPPCVTRLAEVIDPDSAREHRGPRFVVASSRLHGAAAFLTMTLPRRLPRYRSLEDQIRAGIVPLGCVDDIRVAWSGTGLAPPATIHRQRPASSCAASAHHLI